MEKEMLNICYKYFNRYITSDELIDELVNIKMDDREKLDKLIDDIKEVCNNTSNEADEYVFKEKEQKQDIIEKLEKIPNVEDYKIVNKVLNNLKEDEKKDSYERWIGIVKCINENDYFNKEFESLTDEELLEFITQSIKAPLPPQLNQKEFDKLVKVGIEKDDRESLWRLAYNYDNGDIKIDKVADYYIKVKDGYYLSELICIASDLLDIDSIINKVNDKELIDYLIEDKDLLINYITEEQFKKIEKKKK